MHEPLGALTRAGERGRDMDGFANTSEGNSPRFADCWVGLGGEEERGMKNEPQVFALSSWVEAVVIY